MSILVTGGAGYIGRHVVRALAQRGDEVVVADLPELADRAEAPFVGVDLTTDAASSIVADAMRAHGVTAVLHLAARKRVDESVARPAWYFRQNVGGLVSVLDAAEAAGVDRIVFSSTAAVYASSDAPVTESGVVAPANPYGESKATGERLVAAHAAATGARAISLRYFNVAGSVAPELAETDAHNLIPLAIAKITAGEAPIVFGVDYATADGSCVRDYIHIVDLAEAHLAALDALEGAGAPHRVFNVGTGAGASVLEVLASLRAVSGIDLAPLVAPRRAGDPAVVVADPSLIARELGWRADRGLDDIVRSAWETRRA